MLWCFGFGDAGNLDAAVRRVGQGRDDKVAGCGDLFP